MFLAFPSRCGEVSASSSTLLASPWVKMASAQKRYLVNDTMSHCFWMMISFHSKDLLISELCICKSELVCVCVCSNMVIHLVFQGLDVFCLNMSPFKRNIMMDPYAAPKPPSSKHFLPDDIHLYRYWNRWPNSNEFSSKMSVCNCWNILTYCYFKP